MGRDGPGDARRPADRRRRSVRHALPDGTAQRIQNKTMARDVGQALFGVNVRCASATTTRTSPNGRTSGSTGCRRFSSGGLRRQYTAGGKAVAELAGTRRGSSDRRPPTARGDPSRPRSRRKAPANQKRRRGAPPARKDAPPPLPEVQPARSPRVARPRPQSPSSGAPASIASGGSSSAAGSSNRST